MLQPNRCGGENYRYSINGSEKDDEVKGKGNHYDLGLRNYDPRLMRMMSIDPRAREYPWQTPYAHHRNNPIAFIDFLGGGAPSKRKMNDGINKGQGNKNAPANGDPISRPILGQFSSLEVEVEFLDEVEIYIEYEIDEFNKVTEVRPNLKLKVKSAP